MTSKIVEFDPPRRIVDEMVRGPFTAFRHEDLFEAFGSGTRMTDVVTSGRRFGFWRSVRWVRTSGA